MNVALVGGSAVLSGRPARVIAALLRSTIEERQRRDGMQLDPELAAAVHALTEAGRIGDDLHRFRSPSVDEPQCHPDRRLLDAAEAAQLLGVTGHRVRQLARAGRLCPVTRSRPMRFDRDEVEMIATERRG